MFKDFKQLGYFDELRKDVLEAWMKSHQGLQLEEQIKEIISSHAQVSRSQYSNVLEVEEEKARLTSLIRDKISESGVLKSFPKQLLQFVKLPEWTNRINNDLESMKFKIGSSAQSADSGHGEDVQMEDEQEEGTI
jgi:hypothetical protein